MLFQGKKDAFLWNTVNKHHVISAILTELKKPECNGFHSYDDVGIDVTKLSVQSSFKYLISEIIENKNLFKGERKKFSRDC